MRYTIDYGFGYAYLYTPCAEWESRFNALASTCFGIRKNITKCELVESAELKYEKLDAEGNERLEFSGDIYIWRKDGARKMIEPWRDDEWNTDYCEECCPPVKGGHL